MSPDRRQTLLEKLATLPDEKLTEVDDFIDFLVQRRREREDRRFAAVSSEAIFAEIWANPEDDIYNAS